MDLTRRRSRRGMNLVELIVALIVVATISVVAGVLAFRSSQSTASDQSATVQLSAVQLAARQYAATSHRDLVDPSKVTAGQYPTNLITQMSVPSATLVSELTDATGSGNVSVKVVDPATLVLVKRGADTSCVLLVESLSTAARWGIDTTTTTGQCTAANAYTVRATATSTDPLHPSSINLP